MSIIIDFYRGTGTDAKGRTFNDYMAFDHAAIEQCHNHIQYQFPLPEPSKVQPGSPLLTHEDIQTFKADENLRSRVLLSLDQFRVFLGATVLWHKKFNHNHLRITRAIRFLTLIGMREEARTFRRLCVTSHPGLPVQTAWYWQEALSEHPAFLAMGFTGPPSG